MAKNAVIRQYLKKGKRLTVLDGKIPLLKNWTERKISDEQLYDYEGNIGWVIGPGDLVVDVDTRNDGMQSYKKLQQDLDIHLFPTVRTPSGGFHVYLKIPKGFEGKDFKKNVREYPGIDFLTEGSQCVIPSSVVKKGEYVWMDDMLGCFEQSLASKKLVALLAYDQRASQEDLGDFTGLIGGNSANWDEDKISEMLNKLDPSMGNYEWVKVGMALHDWDPSRGLELWEEWSKGGDNYDEGETEKRWRSFKPGNGVTVGTLSHMARVVDFSANSKKVNDLVERIKLADEEKLQFDICPEIKNLEISRLNQEILVKAIQDRLKELAGVRMPIRQVRSMVTQKDGQLVTGQFIEDGEKPNWCKPWIYVNSHAGFMRVTTLKLHKSESFNVENGKYVPENEMGGKAAASKYVADKGYVDKVDTIAYLPSFDGLIYENGGTTYLNSFNKKSIPVEADKITEDGAKAIEIIKRHIMFICSNKENASIFTQWLAHQVQHPGRQVLWSPVIQSIQGVGKSFFGEMLRYCLGDVNVGTVSPSQVTSDFNGWATNVLVNVLEELRVKGHNRFDVINALKPLITDRMIQINDKGVKQHMTYNTTNYMCFTNYKDSLPLEQDDRRWWVLFVPIQSLDEMPKYVGEEAVTYFPRLFNCIRKYGHEVRRWLLDYEITKEFKKLKQAPMTSSKLTMIATEETSFEGLIEVKDMIKQGGQYYNEDVVSSVDLFAAMEFEYPDLDFKTTRRNLLLKRLGYTLLPHPVKVDGKSRRLWTKQPMEAADARALLMDL